MMHTHVENWTLDDVSLQDRESRWSELLSSTHLDMAVRLSSDRPARPFAGSIRRLWIDDLALIDVASDPCRGTRDLSRIKNDGADYIVVLINRAGRESVALDDASATMNPGDALIWDSTLPVKFQVWEPLTKRSLMIPRSALEEISGHKSAPAGMILNRDSPATQLLTGYLDILARSIEDLPAAAVGAARNATLNLVMGALQPGSALESAYSSGPALRAVIGQWIEKNLLRFDLTPSVIALEHAVSVRTVHRVFEQSGDTVGAFIRQRRLARARAELIESPKSITVLALKWGFSDPSHFTRAFRARYGCSPSSFRAEPYARESTASQSKS